MNHTQVLKRAWQAVWSYRALWIFGVIVALTTFSWPTAALFDGDDDWDVEDWEEHGIVITPLPGETVWEAVQRTVRPEVDEANRALNEFLKEVLRIDLRVSILVIFAILTAAVVAAHVMGKIARYVSETALIRMVGAYQQTGERSGVRQGLRLGWSRSAWRLFLINLLIDVLAVLAGLLLFGVILAPLPLWVDGSEGVIFTFAFLTGGLFLVAISVVIVAGTGVSVWKRLARQACALEDLRAAEAIGRGWGVLRRHLKDAGLTWLITFGLKLGWAIVMVPIVLLLIGLGLMIGGLPGVGAGALAGLAATGDTPLWVGLALGIPIFLFVLVAPLVLFAGLREVLVSSLWTLTYREIRGLKSLEPEPLPVVHPSGLEAAPAR